MKVVVNAGPLMALGKLGVVSLLRDLYESILLPESVYQETVIEGLAQGHSDAHLIYLEIRRGHMQVVPVSEIEIPDDIKTLPLDRGERDTIYLAMRENVDLVLLDDLRARETARAYGLKVRGTLGILVQAYRQNLLSLDEVHLLIETIMIRSDIWIAESLCRQVLERLLAEA